MYIKSLDDNITVMNKELLTVIVLLNSVKNINKNRWMYCMRLRGTVSKSMKQYIDNFCFAELLQNPRIRTGIKCEQSFLRAVESAMHQD